MGGAWGSIMKRTFTAAACSALALWLGGCSTLHGDFHQSLQVDALDARDRPVEGMRCQIGTGASAKTFVTPATDVRVRRGMEPLNVECHLDNLVATATVKSRRERMEEALLPFGSVGVFVDHLSGSLYAYPTKLHLRVGQHLVLEHSGEAQVAQAEPLHAATQAEAAAQARTELAAVQTTTVATKASSGTAAPAPHKAAARPPKAQRAGAKPVKPASVAANTATAKPKATPSKSAVASTAAAAGVTAAVVHSAPVNW
jgi:hypothetical protein